MERDILQDLLAWKNKKNRKPIILRGARQVGKTTVIRELGNQFTNYIEINFEETPDIKSLFQNNLNPEEIIKNLNAYLNVSIEENKSLLFLDEIQECLEAIKALRYFYEKKPELHVIAAGSLLEFELEKISFPVGRVEFYYLYPLSFGEFLNAQNNKTLRDKILKGDKLPEALHKKLLQSIRDYTIIGGMPEIVQLYTNNNDYNECQDAQTALIETFQADFNKYAKKHQIKYLETVFNAIPSQISRKLKYTNLSNLYKSRELGEALHLLELAGLITKVYHSSANGVPLEHEKDFKKFKVLFFDTGMATRILRIPIKDLIISPDVTLINEGAIAEQLIGQEMIAYSSNKQKAKLFYWHREQQSSNAEVDYVIDKEGKIIPIEVKSGKKNRMTSLKIYIEEKQCDLAYCISTNQVPKMDKIEFFPLYSVERIFRT